MLAFHGAVKPILCFLDLVADLREVGNFKWCPVFINEVFQRNAMKTQITVMQIKAILWEIICLLNKVKITVLHSSGQVAGKWYHRPGQKYKNRYTGAVFIKSPTTTVTV